MKPTVSDSREIDPNRRKLEPATPDLTDERPAYMPKLPWKWILGLGGFIALAVGAMYVQDVEEAAALRKAVLKLHQQDLAPVVGRYEELVGKINGWVTKAAQAEKVDAYVDERLTLDLLHRGEGLYLRLKASDARTPEGIVNGLEATLPDAIGRCLGVAPKRVGELYARGSFLTGTWIKQAEDTDSVMKLRVIAEEIRQRTKRDLPFVAEAARASWLMFVLERGETRREAPVDVYLYELRSNKLLLRARVQGEGALVSARIALNGVKPGAYASGEQTGAAQDCSIAQQLRAMTGKEAVEFGSEPPAPKAAYEQAQGSLPAPAEGPSPPAK